MDWLADQSPIDIRLKSFAPYAGSLSDEALTCGETHLQEKTKITVPLATASVLVERGLAEVCVPACFSDEVIRNLRENCCVVHLRKFHPFFFEVGVKVAQLTNDSGLFDVLISTAKSRLTRLTQICLESCDHEEKFRGVGSSSGVSSHINRVELDVFVNGLTNTEQHIRQRYTEQLLPNDGRPLLWPKTTINSF